MPDVFDEVEYDERESPAPVRAAAPKDIFDEIEYKPDGDIFDQVDYTPPQESIRAHMGDAVDALPGGYGFAATQPRQTPSLSPVMQGDALGQIPQFNAPVNPIEGAQARDIAQKQAEFRQVGTSVINEPNTSAPLIAEIPKLPNIPASRNESTASGVRREFGNAASGLINFATGIVNFFQSGDGLLLLSTGKLPVGSALRRSVYGTVAAAIVKDTPQVARELAKKFNQGDTAGAIEQTFNLLSLPLFAKHLGTAALNERPLTVAQTSKSAVSPVSKPAFENESRATPEPAGRNQPFERAVEPTGAEPIPRQVEPAAQPAAPVAEPAPATPGGELPPAAEIPAPVRPSEPSEVIKLTPVLVDTEGKVIAQGETHADALKKNVTEETIDAFANDDQHKFVDQNGTVLTRQEAAQAVGKEGALQSADIPAANKPGKTPRGPTVKQEFGALALDYASKTGLPFGDILLRNREDLPPSAKAAHNEALQSLRRRVFKELGLENLDPLNTANVKTALAKLKERMAAVDEQVNKPAEIDPGGGMELENADSPVTGADWLDAEEEAAPAAVPKLRANEKGTGELLQGADAPFNLSGETGIDFERVAKEKADAKQRAAEAKAIANKQQQEMASLGGQNPADPREIAKSELAQLTDSIKTLAESGKSSPAKAFDLGESWNKAKDRISRGLDGLRAAAQWLRTKQEGKPVVTDYRRALGQRHLALSESAVNARKWAASALKAMPNAKLRAAISSYVDAGGDTATLERGAAETKPAYKAAYERALKLSPEEKTVADNLRNYFESRLQDAIDAGILEDGIENYIHRIYESDSPWRKGVLAELQSGIFTGKPALAKKRVFEYDFEAEKAGKHPIKDFVKRVAAYDLALNKSIADRAAVKAMLEIKMPDGRPMIDVGGGAKKIEGPNGETDATLINRSEKKIDPDDPKADRSAYKPLDYPALRKWKWVTTDDAGKPIFVQGDVLIHPDAIPQVKALFERSAIRANPVGRAALDASSLVKQTMLDLSGFHFTQITVHGWEHRSFKPVGEIDFTNPDVRGLIKGGLSVGDTTGYEHFSEGLSGSSLTRHIPVLGERLQAVNSYLFNEYIPRLKVATGLHALERNRERFKNLSEEELQTLTANQMNSAFGELNYTMMGRSKTTQDVFRLALLAPDFLEARAGFVGQAATKFGKEQRVALAVGIAAMYITARILNKTIDDEYHMELKNAFNVVINGKAYGLRTVQGDLIHLATKPFQFIRNRLNPIYGRTAMEAVSGRDAFGRERTTGQQIGDAAKTIIPISVRGAFSGKEQTLFESFLNSVGIVEHRESPAGQIYDLADKFKKKNKIQGEPGEFIYDPDKDPYRKIRLAASYYDPANVRSEIAAALYAGLTKQKIKQHFELSAAHKFTGSAAHEKEFLKTLTADEKKIYQDALKEREKIKATVNAALK